MNDLYQHVAVASTFSPRFHAVLAEGARVAGRLGGAFSVVHAAEADDERRGRFASAFERLQLAHDTSVLWSASDSAVDGILGACRSHSVDLLVAGALEIEIEHRYFLGGVARGLMKRAICDLLLITDPNESPEHWKKIIVEFDFRAPDEQLIAKACSIARRLAATELLFISVRTPFDKAIAAARGEELPDAEAEMVKPLQEPIEFDGEVDAEVIDSTTGFSACDFVQESGAELLIVCSQTATGVRTLPSYMDWLRQVIPTNLLLIGR